MAPKENGVMKVMLLGVMLAMCAGACGCGVVSHALDAACLAYVSSGVSSPSGAFVSE